ncbi:unnamed protein product [Withania somnifera]
MVESASPNKYSTWTVGIQTDDLIIWRLSSIVETPASCKESTSGFIYGSSNLKTPEKTSLRISSGLYSRQNTHIGFTHEDVSREQPLSDKGIGEECPMDEGGSDDIDIAVSKLSLTSRPSSEEGHTWDPFLTLLAACGQSAPLTLLEILSKYCTRVCQGHYDASLLKAWECYAVFIQEHGGKDLESFVLLNFDEARSLLSRVTLALVVSEAAYEFEHRDMHWGNILLSRKGLHTVQFTLEGKEIYVRTYGLLVSIIDFTLSRINTGEDILFLDLSSDPEHFEGPKGDKQFDTYRKMRDVTGEFWEGSFPKTNVLWLQYLVDILLLKKSYESTSKDEKDLRSLKKRLNSYGSAREATSDAFFSDLFITSCID